VGAGEALAAGTTASSYGGRHRIIPDRNCFAAIVFMARTSTASRLLPARPGSFDAGGQPHLVRERSRS
jgi:hypothetical protein